MIGGFVGAMIGDALGSHCEFEGKQSEEKMDKIMSMPGGGTFPIKPGQVTDDSEMAMHLIKALVEYSPSKPMNDQAMPLLCRISE